MARRFAALAFVALLVIPSIGCLELHAARVPDRLLEGRGGNGWARNGTASQSEPTSAQWGFVKTQTLAYEDRATGGDGYPGSLTLATLRTVLRPSESSLLDQLQAKVREQAQKNGIRIDSGPMEGTRRLADGESSFFFVYNGTVERASGFFGTNSRVKILGESWQCADTKTVVVAVALAQITERRSIGGVPVQSDTDLSTWREIINDPRGGIENARGNDGLVYNVDC